VRKLRELIRYFMDENNWQNRQRRGTVHSAIHAAIQPTGYVMHQHVQHSRILRSTHTVFLPHTT